MKNLLLFILCLSTIIGVAQDLYVDANSFIYAKDIVVFVEDDIRLEATDSYFYLRGDAQLLQNSDTKNSDIGKLSVYQEQTVQIYEYNYWASPVGVGINSSTRANVPFDHTNVYRPVDATDLSNVNATLQNWTTSYDATAAPNYELSERWVYKLRDGEGYLGWDYVENGVDNVETGYGFTLKGSPVPVGPLKTLDFRGRPNNGNITVSLNYDGIDDEPLSEPNNQVSTLAGNPYPSALDLKLFFVNSTNNQANTDGGIYFWQQQLVGSHNLQDYEGGYAVYTPGNLGDLNDNGSYAVAVFETYDANGGNNNDNNGTSPDYSSNNSGRYAAIGQGFLINGNVLNGFAEFSNSMRLYFPEDSTTGGNGSIFRNNQDNEVIAMSHNGLDYMDIINNPTIIPEIRIHTHINETYYRENVIAFREGTDLSYNKFCDAALQSVLGNDVYLAAEDKALVIKSTQYHKDLRIPLVIKSSSSNSTFSISVNSLKNTPEDLSVYLYDNLFNTYTSITNESSFNIILDEGIYDDRFEITFENEDTLGEDELLVENFTIYQNNNKSQLSILNPNLHEISSVNLLDISGKRIFNYNSLETKADYYFSTSNLSDGVYIASVTFPNKNQINEKVIVNNQ